MKEKDCLKITILFAFLVMNSFSTELLNGIPISFSLAGNVSYTPTSGGVNIPGYIMRVGFSRYSWIGIKFMTQTSRSLYDILIIKRQTVPQSGYYKIAVSDFFVSAGRQDKLLTDSNNNMDKQFISYTKSNNFQAQIYRTKGNTQGEDWEGGNFIQLCFYTSQNAFNQNIWSGLEESCYAYDVSANYVSTFEGKYITTMGLDGVNGRVYGGIEGPVLQMQLYWISAKTSLSSPNMYIKLGDKISQDIGYDYHQCGSGDYFGQNIGGLTKDTLWSGYNDGLCAVSSSADGTKVTYRRFIYTYDEYDATLFSKNNICIQMGGAQQSCSYINLEILFPVMSVDSALVIWEGFFMGLGALLIVFVIF